MFQVDKVNGKIQTVKNLIGYSGKLKYVLVISDGAGVENFLTGSCPLEIIIKDVNIHSPQFIAPDKNSSIIRIKSVNF